MQHSDTEHVSHYAYKEQTSSFCSLWKSTWNQSHVLCYLPREMLNTSQGRRALISARMCGTFSTVADSCCHGINPGSGSSSASTNRVLLWIFTWGWCICRLWRPVQITIIWWNHLSLFTKQRLRASCLSGICLTSWYGTRGDLGLRAQIIMPQRCLDMCKKSICGNSLQ